MANNIIESSNLSPLNEPDYRNDEPDIPPPEYDEFYSEPQNVYPIDKKQEKPPIIFKIEQPMSSLAKDIVQGIKEANKRKEKPKRDPNKESSPTIDFVKEAFKHHRLTIGGDGNVYDKDGDPVSHPSYIVEKYHDIIGDRDNIKPKYFKSMIELLCSEEQKDQKKKMIADIGTYKFDPNINLKRAAQIMLSGVDFTIREGRERLQKFEWGIESSILQMKRKMNKLPIFDHKVVVLVGSYSQGDQKSEFVKELFNPLGFYNARVSLRDIADNGRNYHRFVDNFGLHCDELKGADPSQTAEIKETITADFLYVRVLGSHKIIKVPNNSTLMGTSNYPVYTVFQDSSGSRRFLDLDVTEDVKRDRFLRLKNEIDWKALWRGVKYEYTQEEITDYLGLRDEIIAPFQKENTFKDVTDEFLEENGIKAGDDFVKSNWLHQELMLYIDYKGYKIKRPSIQAFGGQISNKYGIKSLKFRGERGYYIDKQSFEQNSKRSAIQS